MRLADIARLRMHNQWISREQTSLPEEAVAWLGGLQAQDLNSARWAVGLRCQVATESDIERSIAGGAVVRTWLMRGTLQFVSARDVHWMLALLAPRIVANSARRLRQLELDALTLVDSYETIAAVLHGVRHATRQELLQALEQAGISTSDQRGYHILRQAGLSGLICFGPSRDGEQTLVLLDEWVSDRPRLAREQTLAQLAVRYFVSHGPATLQDFMWWSGVRAGDARAGLEEARTRLQQVSIDGSTYWAPLSDLPLPDPSPTAYLLPAYDEYYLGYKAREAVLDPSYDKRAVSSSGVFRSMVVVDGQIVGTWKRQARRDSVVISTSLFAPLTGEQGQALVGAVDQYGRFVGKPVVLQGG